jgi:uncharacterized protein YdeI (YjbR/CyaY-like superfamily)
VRLARQGEEPAIFFESAAQFRDWLDANHASADELWVGFLKKASGRTGLTYAEAVDEALCYGWIDGLTRGRDAESYVQRFTPRRPGSNWSAVNVAKVAELTREGRMRPAGVRAFEQRSEAKTGVYSYENRPAELPDEYAATFREAQGAWEWFSGQPPSYRKAATWWVVSAKREETRQRRLAALIERSAAGRRIDALSPP